MLSLDLELEPGRNVLSTGAKLSGSLLDPLGDLLRRLSSFLDGVEGRVGAIDSSSYTDVAAVDPVRCENLRLPSDVVCV